jgi:non-specific serine/threonine protein kinase
VKLDEVVRELGENVGEHKALVFSQFLGMLALIRAQLEKEGIPYAYFDGSSTTAERVAAVNAFQDDPDTRVFLISLKAVAWVSTLLLPTTCTSWTRGGILP